MIKFYVVGALVNMVIIGIMFYGTAIYRSEDRKLKMIDEKLKAVAIFGAYILGSWLITLYLLYNLSLVLGDDIQRLGRKKNNYKIYMIGKIMEFEYYGERTYSNFVVDKVMSTRRKKSVYRMSKIYDNYNGLHYYYKQVIERAYRIKRAKKK